MTHVQFENARTGRTGRTGRTERLSGDDCPTLSGVLSGVWPGYALQEVPGGEGLGQPVQGVRGTPEIRNHHHHTEWRIGNSPDNPAKSALPRADAARAVARISPRTVARISPRTQKASSALRLKASQAQQLALAAPSQTEPFDVEKAQEFRPSAFCTSNFNALNAPRAPVASPPMRVRSPGLMPHPNSIHRTDGTRRASCRNPMGAHRS